MPYPRQEGARSCPVHGLACSTSYRKHKCKCEECLLWYDENKARNRDKMRAAERKYRKTEKGRSNNVAKSSHRRALELEQAPDLTPEDAAMMRDLFLERDRLTKETGVQWHVDHICPLAKGGVHHPCNLRLMRGDENIAKSDSWDGESGVTMEQYLGRDQ